MKFLLIICVFLVVVSIILHFSIISDLRDITDDLNECYNYFAEDLHALAETLQVYHELLDDYQIPMIQLPEQKKDNQYSDW